jgi:hypothetical protein
MQYNLLFGLHVVNTVVLVCITLVFIQIFFGINPFVGSWVFSSFYNDYCLLCALIPIKNYSNAEADKGKIIQDNKDKSGIYM